MLNTDVKSKPTANKLAREIVIPSEVAERYIKYCEVTKMKISEPLRVLVMESLPQLHNAENLDQIISKTKNWKDGGDSYTKFQVRLPDEVIKEIHTLSNFFHIKRLRCHFLYYLIEEKLLQKLEDVLKDE